MKFRRYIKDQVIADLSESKRNKAVIIYGARQVGKTTLVQEVVASLGLSTLTIDADLSPEVNELASLNYQKFKDLIGSAQLVFIDEAQRVPNIGLVLKILVDKFPDTKIIATGSSSFELANKVSEPLTGRKWVYQLYPISQMELVDQWGSFQTRQLLETQLRFGSYPEVFSLVGEQEKIRYLQLLASDFLYKDVLGLAGIKNADKLKSLLRLLAYQIGQVVSYNELANNLDLSKQTVQRYLDLLEKSFVIFKLPGFSRNLRKEVTKMPKYYFWDLGVRNALVQEFKPLDLRNDVGQLWENFLVIERLKYNQYVRRFTNQYFWRTYTGAEIDYIEEYEGELYGYEFKWSVKRKIRPPQTWFKTYNKAHWTLVTPDNYLDFVSHH